MNYKIDIAPLSDYFVVIVKDKKTDELKDTFRHDFHQILAYCSLNSMTTKQAMLVYPFSDFTYHKMTVNSPTTNSEAQVYLVGIPLEKNRMEEVKKELNDIINFN